MKAKDVTVCICTYKRPELLERTLIGLAAQSTEGLFSYSIVVADNDHERSAEGKVSDFGSVCPLPIRYCVEPTPNIALARNKALSLADTEFVAFIDDDEVPPKDWLLTLYQACARLDAHGVLGPVMPYFDVPPKPWLINGKYFDRPGHPTGHLLRWRECRTGNVMFRRSILAAEAEPFQAKFGSGGEDVDFFQRMTEKGYIFRWCNEAPVHEVVPPRRCSFGFLAKRALLRGGIVPNRRTTHCKNVLKSVIAIPTYLLALPVLCVCRWHLGIRYLLKLLEHGSRVLAVLGVCLVKERET